MKFQKKLIPEKNGEIISSGTNRISVSSKDIRVLPIWLEKPNFRGQSNDNIFIKKYYRDFSLKKIFFNGYSDKITRI